MWHNPILNRVKELATSCPKLSHTFRFLTSAIFILSRAELLGHKNRAEYSADDEFMHFDELISTIDVIQKGDLPNDQWMAGFYYNAAVMRINACYERFLVAITDQIPTNFRSNSNMQGRNSKTDCLVQRVESYLELQSPYFERHKLEANRKEVNRLKHELFGQCVDAAKTRGTNDIENAKGAVDELLKMVEYKEILERLRSQYSGNPPP